MKIKKIIITSIIISFTSLTQGTDLHISFPNAEFPDLTDTIAQLNKSISNFNTVVNNIPPNTAALVVFCLSARQIFSKFPEKEASKRNYPVDLGIPVVGLLASAWVMWACNKR